MSERFTIEYNGLHIAYGIDGCRWWVRVEPSPDGPATAWLDDTDLSGILRLLIDHSVFSRLEVAEAMNQLPHVDEIHEIGNGEDEEQDQAIRRAATVILNLKMAAAN